MSEDDKDTPPMGPALPVAIDHAATPGKITQVFSIGPSPCVLTESGLIFALGRADNSPEGKLEWEHIPSPTADDMKRLFK